MSTLTFDAAMPVGAPIDLGPITRAGGEGALTSTGGNLYLHVDGVEFGSLWFHRDADGVLSITLGQYDDAVGDWVERSTLTPIKPVEHAAIVPPIAGLAPACACGWKSATVPAPGHSLADHLKDVEASA